MPLGAAGAPMEAVLRMIGQIEITEDHMAYWRSVDPDARVVIFTAPEDPPDCVPCPGVVTRMVEEGREFHVVRVAWKPNEIELAQLALGGTIWLSTWGGLPPHMLEVQPSSCGQPTCELPDNGRSAAEQ